jgi:hypothetical protein
MGLGFIALIVGMPWWIGVGVIVITAALAVSGDDEEVAVQQMPIPLARAVAKPAAAAKPATAEKKAPWPGWDMDDMKWSPTTFADGMMGVNPMETGNVGSAIGARSGTYTQDMGPIRFKDDFRFRIIGDAGEFYNMCKDVYTDKGLVAWDFRTRKDVFPGLHTGSVKTLDSPDDLTNPGLGSPNEWIAQEKKRKEAQR